jgi:alkanesulfonate monooxygenase SsuD/methylene tetrahydromethanopterin reductase-like flavin-dependent oxidoreductase (luciferase family)
VQDPHPPVIIGGHGRTRTPALAARFAAEYNLPFPNSVQATARQYDRVRAACAEAGRAEDSLRLSVALVLCCGRDDAEVARRASAIGREVDELREHGLAGTPQEVIDRIGEFAAAGASRVYLQVLDLADVEHLELVAAEVLPAV